MLYWDQGDYLGFLEYAKMGIDYKADPDCGMHGVSRLERKPSPASRELARSLARTWR